VRPSIDWLGAVTLTAGVVPLLVAMSSGGRDYAWGSPEIVGLLVTGVVLCAVFLFVEARAQAPIFPLSLFKNRTIWTVSITATAVAAAMFGTMMFIPLFIQGVVGTSATKSGAVVTPMMFSMIASSIVSGQLMTRLGKYKWNAVAGCAVTTVSLFLMATMDVSTSYATVLTYMVVMGVGLGATMPVFNLAVQNAVEHKDVGVSTSSFQFLRSLGGAVGGAVFGAVLTNRFGGAFLQALPDGVAAAMPADELARFSNPQMLMNPATQAQLAQGEALQRLAPILGAVKQALATSLSTVFLIGAIVTAVGLAFTFLLQDLPLRKTRGGGPPPPAAH
jgi:MFS family permease